MRGMFEMVLLRRVNSKDNFTLIPYSSAFIHLDNNSEGKLAMIRYESIALPDHDTLLQV